MTSSEKRIQYNMKINKGERTEIKVTNGTAKDGKIIRKDLVILTGRKQGHPEGPMMPCDVLLLLIQVMTYRCAVTFGGAQWYKHCFLLI